MKGAVENVEWLAANKKGDIFDAKGRVVAGVAVFTGSKEVEGGEPSKV